MGEMGGYCIMSLKFPVRMMNILPRDYTVHYVIVNDNIYCTLKIVEIVYLMLCLFYSKQNKSIQTMFYFIVRCLCENVQFQLHVKEHTCPSKVTSNENIPNSS